MAEILTLTTPVNITSYRIADFWWNKDASALRVIVANNLGVRTTVNYVDAKARAIMNTINNGNFSGKSLEKSLLEYLRDDGVLPAGTVSGTPD